MFKSILLTLALVTATVTSLPSTETGVAKAQGSRWVAVLTDKDDGAQMMWNRPFESQSACNAAISGIPERLAAIALINQHPDSPSAPAAPLADQKMLEAIDQAVVGYLMNLSRLPNWTIECVVPGANPT